ncbi:hypothetical protein EE612_015150 [Oryza sativa]|nr:hypothetical protein EE612_015150 [Oryza sativa]
MNAGAASSPLRATAHPRWRRPSASSSSSPSAARPPLPGQRRPSTALPSALPTPPGPPLLHCHPLPAPRPPCDDEKEGKRKRKRRKEKRERWEEEEWRLTCGSLVILESINRESV